MKPPIQLDIFQSEINRDKGIKKALDSAEELNDGWANQAFIFLRNYIKSNNHFMAEEVRKASEGIVPNPPSERAWGGIIVRARKEKLIKRIGYQNVTNPKAHRTPAAVWGRI